MNLLAQAMICLTEPATRTAYDQKLLPSPPVINLGDADELPLQLVDEPPAAARPVRLDRRAQPDLDPLRLPPETYSLEDEPDADALLIPELIDDEPLTLAEEEDEEDEPETRSINPRPDRTPKTRRDFYRSIVRIRRVLRIWERLRAYLDDPEKTFDRRIDTIAFMSCLAELQPLLPSVADLVGGPNQPGHLVAALARQQLVVEMFRSLLPSQRLALTRDCQSAHYCAARKIARACAKRSASAPRRILFAVCCCRSAGK